MSNLDRVKREPTDQATQKTTPKKGKPVEIPVPAKSQIMRDFERIATAPVQKDQGDGDKQGQSRTD
jgi:hypothetical protein